jgi:hypothetical protein
MTGSTTQSRSREIFISVSSELIGAAEIKGAPFGRRSGSGGNFVSSSL